MVRGSSVGGTQFADLLEALRALGADTTALCESMGLPTVPPSDPAERVRSSPVLALLEAAGHQLRDPLVGLHAGARVQTRGSLFYLLMSTPRVSDGLRQFSRFARVPLDTQDLRVSLREGVVELTVELGDPELEESHQAVDYIMGANLSSLRRSIPGFQLLAVDLTHAEVGARGETARTFGCPVRFDRSRNVMRFADSVLRGVSAAANAAIAEQIEKLAASVLARITSTRVEERVSDAIRAMLAAGIPADRSAVARRLHVSERTLQRQLEQRLTSFKTLRDGVRLDLSRALLSNPGLKVEAIAQSVGFAEVASFSKAFARWSGHSPTGYRARVDRTAAAP